MREDNALDLIFANYPNVIVQMETLPGLAELQLNPIKIYQVQQITIFKLT